MGVAPENNNSYTENVQIASPIQSDPIVCIIDSGIQEMHKYLESAILHDDSMSLLPNNSSVSDEVTGGGHGTRVTGAVLYPSTIPTSGVYQLPCWIRNMRILDENNCLPEDVYPPKAIAIAVQKYNINNPFPTKIFNHSIGSHRSCELKHMTSWAAELIVSLTITIFCSYRRQEIFPQM